MKKIINWSYNNKVISIGILLSISSFIWQFTISYLDFSSLKKISGQIKEIKINNGKKKSLNILLRDDSNTYYQKYSYRFSDNEIFELNKDQFVYFFTTKTPKYSNGALIGKYGQKGFYYYPLFNINGSKNYFSIFLQKFYEVSVLNIIILASIAVSAFYSIFLLSSTNWKNRIFPICIMIILFWLLY